MIQKIKKERCEFMIKEFTRADFGTIRVSLIDDEPCFCLEDLCKILKIRSVPKCREKLNQGGVKLADVTDSEGKVKRKLFVTADNVSTVIFQSTRKEADDVNDWIFRLILPQAKLYVKYSVEDLKDPDIAIKLLDEYENIGIRVSVLESEKRINEPKITSMDILFGSRNCVDIDIVHELLRIDGIKNTRLLKILRLKGVLGDDNIAKQEYCDKHFFRVVEAKAIEKGKVIISKHTFVYKSGISFIERILNEFKGESDENGGLKKS